MSTAVSSDFNNLLNKINGHDVALENVSLTQIRRWHRTQEEQRAYSFARGYVIGRALKFQRDKLKHGEKSAWAKKLGISSQSINTYIRGFEAIVEAETEQGGFDVPDLGSFTGWVRSSAKTNRPKAPRPLTREQWIRRVESTLFEAWCNGTDPDTGWKLEVLVDGAMDMLSTWRQHHPNTENGDDHGPDDVASLMNAAQAALPLPDMDALVDELLGEVSFSVRASSVDIRQPIDEALMPTLMARAEAEAASFPVPFTSTDLGQRLGVSRQKATSLLKQLGWQSRPNVYLGRGKRGRRWLPTVVPATAINDVDVVMSWHDLHEDHMDNLWDQFGWMVTLPEEQE